MQHSIAARFAARPAARFVRPSPRLRERRLGLRVTGSFQPASPHATVRPIASMSWARFGRPGVGRRSGAASAPWLG